MISTELSISTEWDRWQSPGVPLGSNSLQHGTAVFEGIRAYEVHGGQAAFRLEDHLRRLLRSARRFGMAHHHDLDSLRGLVWSAARGVERADIYLRPTFFASSAVLGLDLRQHEFGCAVEVWPAGLPPAPGEGVRLTVSPWRRPHRDSFPVGVKATGTYAVSAMARTAAAEAGFDDAIQLDAASGRVAEASTSNLFIVRGRRLLTPWRQESLLPGITRDTVLALAEACDLAPAEVPVRVADLYEADEVFLTGTASELVPVAEIDGYHFDPSGPCFRALATAFHDATRGHRFSDHGWLTPIPPLGESSFPTMRES